MDAIIGKELYRTIHRYQEFQPELVLIFFQAEIAGSASLQNFVFERFEWADLSTLPQYSFLQADNELVGLLASGSIQLE